MSDILIKGMEMPKNGEMKKIIIGRAPNGIDPIAIVTGDNTEFYKIIEVFTPHGRLIDADALMECRLEPNHYEELKDGYIPDYDLDSAPTIIEAEE